ncbi:MAG: DUF3427 domain-containing protein [bacterium]|nr:DUF3427 domain-containing protein [bacterium]
MMKRHLRPGLYEDLVTSSLKREIGILLEDNWSVETGVAEENRRADVLARHVADLLRRALDGMSAERQIELANRLLGMLGNYGVPEDEQVAGTAELLLSVFRSQGLEDQPVAAERPIRSLRDTGLLVNGRRDVQVSGEIVREIPSADGIDLLCAFVRYSGLRLFQRELGERIAAGVPVRVITTVYTGTTERRALDALHELGAKVKVSFDVARTRLHAKAWLFRRESGHHTAYIGSSNLTHTAQVDGLEWNVRVSATRNPEVIDRFQATFEQYWQESEFEAYEPERDGKRLDDALKKLPGGAPGVTLYIDAVAKPHQEAVLEALEAERRRGHHRNLVVAATGTGKTWVAAFDFRRLRQDHQVQSLLFIAHRREILAQSQQVFQIVLRDPSFGEKLVAGKRPQEGRHVFASVQSLQNRIDGIDPSGFDVVIIDEFHHAAASSYERLLERLRPRFLLGLTATPERTDGKSVLDWFDGRIASESRLWDALDQGLLCPFHYFGINDGTDLSGVRFQQGRYVSGELDTLFTGDHVRARRILQAIVDHVPDPQRMRALGFCAGVGHAHFMAEQFSREGLKAAALDAATPYPERDRALTSLRTGDLHIIFTVDLFNEGVDLPEVDTVLMLRPTESATVFLQQLGRGLRWAEGKQVLTVLDFVGQARREYRFDMRYQALIGGTRQQVRKAVEENFPYLPPGCALRLDRIAKGAVLDNLSHALRTARSHLVEDLRALGPSARLGAFVKASGADLLDIYRRPSSGHCFTDLLERAGFTSRSTERSLMKAVGRMLHVDDGERLGIWRSILTNNDVTVDHLPPRQRRLAWMFFGLLAGDRPLGDADEVFATIRAWRDMRDELIDLLDILADRTRTLAQPLEGGDVNPLASHATYSLAEITAAHGLTDARGVLKRPREGVLWEKASGTDLLFITLEKSEKDYAPSVRYADYPISPQLFHWETQNTTSPDSGTGQRYISGAGKVLLFVRERKRDDRNETRAYHCLGYASCRRHESSRPMKIVWELERMMPGWLYQAGKVVAG